MAVCLTYYTLFGWGTFYLNSYIGHDVGRREPFKTQPCCSSVLNVSSSVHLSLQHVAQTLVKHLHEISGFSDIRSSDFGLYQVKTNTGVSDWHATSAYPISENNFNRLRGKMSLFDLKILVKWCKCCQFCFIHMLFKPVFPPEWIKVFASNTYDWFELQLEQQLLMS